MLGEVSLDITADIDDAMSAIDEVRQAANDLQNEVSSATLDVGSGASAASGSMEGLADATNNAGGSAKGLGRNSSGASKGMAGMAKGASAAGPAIAAVATAAAGATAAIVATTKAINAMTDAIVRAANRGDELAKLATRTGQTVEELQRLEFAASQSDVSMQALERAASRSDKSIEEMADSVRGASTHQEALSIATDEYGDRLGRELLPLLLEGSQGIEELGDKAEEAGIIMRNDAAQASEEFNDRIDLLSRSISSISDNISGDMIPAANAFLGVVEAFITPISRTVSDINALEESGSRLASQLETTAKIIEENEELIVELTTFGVLFLKEGLDDLVELIEQTNKALSLLNGEAEDVAGTIQQLGRALEITGKAVNKVGWATGNLIPGLREMGSVAEYIGANMASAAEKTQEFNKQGREAVSITGALTSALEGAAGATGSFLGDLFEGADDVGGRAVEWLKEQLEESRREAEELRKEIEEMGSGDGDEMEEVGSTRLKILEKETQLLLEQDEIEKRKLQKEIAYLEKEEKIAEIKDRNLSDEAEAAKIEKVRAEYKTRQKELEGEMQDLRAHDVEYAETELKLMEKQTRLMGEQDELKRLKLEKEINELELKKEIEKINEKNISEEARALKIQKAQAKSAEERKRIEKEINEIKGEQNNSASDVFGTIEGLNSELSRGLSIIDDMVGASGRLEGALSGALDAASGISGVLGATSTGGLLGGAAGIAGGIVGGISSLFSSSDDGGARHETARTERRKRNRELAKAIVDEQEDRFDRPLALQVGTAGALRGERRRGENRTSRDVSDLAREFPERRL